MTILKIVVMFILWLVIIPFLTGILPSFTFEKSKKRVGTIYMSGWIFMTAIFQLLAVPFIIAMRKFSDLEFVYSTIIAFVAVVSLVFLIVRVGLAAIVDFVELPALKKLQKKEILCWVIFFATLIFQIFMNIYLKTSDGDDSYYVTHAVIATQKNVMYTENAYTGVYNNLEYRHILAPFSMFIAFIARKLDVHATIVAHTLFPPVLICLTYLIYYKICQALLPNENDKHPIFMIILSGLQIFGATSIYTNSTFFLTRTWQGKSVLANVIIPFAFYMLLQLCRQTEKEEYHRYRLSGIFFLLFLTNISGALTSSLGLLLLLIFEMSMFVLIAIRNKRINIVLAGAIALLPCYAYMLLYLFFK